MVFSPNELVQVVNEELDKSLPYKSYPGMPSACSGGIAMTLNSLRDGRAVHYNALHLINKTFNGLREINKGFPPGQTPDRLTKEIERMLEKERNESRILIKDLNRQIKETNIKYTVVASSIMLDGEIVARSERDKPHVLMNGRGTWYTSELIGKNYYDMVKSFPDSELYGIYTCLMYKKHMTVFTVPEKIDMCSVAGCKISGKAIIHAGNNKGHYPVLLSMKCTFDLAGHVDGLPDTYRVLMFRPEKVNLAMQWSASKPMKPETEDTGTGEQDK